jgi:hypothetical protein
MPAGVSAKREREFQKLEQRFKQEGRYRGREEEVAARIVNKQRSQYGETKEEQQKDKQGQSPDKNLPLKDYQKLTIPQIASQLESLSMADIRKVRTYEAKHKNRKGLMEKLDRRLSGR